MALAAMLPIIHAAAETRVALIIGNSAYQKAELRLPNPANDATAMARALKAAGFETVVQLNASRTDFYRALGQFADKISRDPHAVGLFYYAGHAVQADGVNWLIPVDANISSQADLEPSAFDAARVLKSMADARNDMNIVILDACRNNPLPKTRGMDRGLARLDAPSGTFIAFAAAPGQTAQDGAAGTNGVFTGEFINAMKEPGLPLEQMFKKVIVGVRADTKGEQTPWSESSIQGEFAFIAKNASGATTTNVAAAAAAATPGGAARTATAPTTVGAADRPLVDPAAIGHWTMQVGGSTWYWDVKADGTYSSWSVGAQPGNHSGTVTVANGHWTLNATTMQWADGGTYVFPNPNTFIVTGRLGTGAWLRLK